MESHVCNSILMPLYIYIVQTAEGTGCSVDSRLCDQGGHISGRVNLIHLFIFVCVWVIFWGWGWDSMGIPPGDSWN